MQSLNDLGQRIAQGDRSAINILLQLRIVLDNQGLQVIYEQMIMQNLKGELLVAFFNERCDRNIQSLCRQLIPSHLWQ